MRVSIQEAEGRHSDSPPAGIRVQRPPRRGLSNRRAERLLRRPHDPRELPPLSRPARAPLLPLAGSRPRQADNRAGSTKGHVGEAGAGPGRKGAKGAQAGEGRGVSPRWRRDLSRLQARRPGTRGRKRPLPDSVLGSPRAAGDAARLARSRPAPSTPHLLVEGVDGVHVRVAAAAAPGPPVT